MCGTRLTAEEIDRIHELRARKLSQDVVAAMIGRDRTTVARHSPGQLVPHALAPEQIAEIQRLRADGHSSTVVAEMVGVNYRTVLTYGPGRPGKVPVAPVREAFLASPVIASDVARELGWWTPKGADSARVKRTLGIMPDISRHAGRRSYRNLVDAETVMLIAEAIGISPWSVLPDDDEQVAA